MLDENEEIRNGIVAMMLGQGNLPSAHHRDRMRNGRLTGIARKTL